MTEKKWRLHIARSMPTLINALVARLGGRVQLTAEELIIAEVERNGELTMEFPRTDGGAILTLTDKRKNGKLKWSRKPPMSVGYYWFAPEGTEEVELVHVQGMDSEFLIQKETYRTENLKGEWYGPLEPPR